MITWCVPFGSCWSRPAMENPGRTSAHSRSVNTRADSALPVIGSPVARRVVARDQILLDRETVPLRLLHHRSDMRLAVAAEAVGLVVIVKSLAKVAGLADVDHGVPVGILSEHRVDTAHRFERRAPRVDVKLVLGARAPHKGDRRFDSGSHVLPFQLRARLDGHRLGVYTPIRHRLDLGTPSSLPRLRLVRGPCS